MNIISIATAETKWTVPRPAIILYHAGEDTRYRLDCERLFDSSDQPSNPLSWFDLDGPWLQKARKIFDSTARDFQFADGQWQRGKSCDTFAPMGQTIVTTDTITDPHKLSIKLTLNREVMQDSNTDQLIFGVPQLIEFISQSITLEPGDVIATGTPSGVGFARKPPVFLKPGDEMEVLIEGMGGLGNPVVAEQEN